MSNTIVSTKTYFVTFLSLLVLLVLTIAVAFVPLGRFGWVAAMTISAAKTALIAAFFMHLRSSHRVVWIAAFCVWLALMMVLSLADFWTRDWLQQ